MFRSALRNLARNRWRTRLTAGGVAVAVAFLVWIHGVMDAFLDAMVDNVTRVEIGDVVVQTPEWIDSPSMYAAFDAGEARLRAIGKAAGVEAAAPRLQTWGLVGHEETSQVARLVGVDPARDGRVSSVPDSIVEGSWLTRARGDTDGPIPAVLAEGLARQLGVGPGDELVVILQAADGSLGNDVLHVTGIARTGNSAFDRYTVVLPLRDAGTLTALEGRAHEVLVRLERGADPEVSAAAVRDALGGSGGGSGMGAEPLTVRTWREVVPELSQLVELSSFSMSFLYGIVFIVSGLGLVNAQRMSVLERQRELGVMLAIGTTPARVATLLVVETGLLTAIGATVGALLGLAANAWFARHGFDMRMLSSEGTSFSYQGTTFSVLEFHVTASSILLPAVSLLVLGLVCGLWPAFRAARIDAARAIAGRT